ncbi:coiled-coil domain-containing protein 7 [Eublepharis macularius]|uniref:Coiled-coil domain-containing protein 7 n=1 Tax=Eublepharis macularius TaxID=481883 RepID=A0AA97L8J3_EUBMA|nr:coiled-coil domain-containing protein 7 [Eublepharis macularius]
MNATKQMKQTPLQKRPVLDYSPPGLKKKGKQNFEVNPMVLLPSDTPESIAQYSIDLPSVNKDSVLDEMDMLKNITVHLNQIVQTMEHVYTKDDKTQEEGEEEEETLPDECEDMLSFLVFCSQLSNQLEGALREEKQILESLLKWFEKEVQMLEELGEEEIIPDSQVPAADKNITDNINKLINRIQRLEDLKGRVQELPKYIRTSTPRERRRQLGPPPPIPKDPKNIIEELAMKHTTEDVMNMVQVFQDDSGAPQTIESMNSRMIEIMKIFERQTNKLHRVTNEQDVLEGKLQKIQQEFRKLAEEKQIMEDELQKMKTSDIALGKASTDTRKKLLAKLEKEKGKVEEKTGAQPEKGKRPSGTQRVKESEAVKMKEDLVKAQANIQSLEREKKMLEERLQQVLEEAYKTRGELAEIPPDIPDWEFPYTAVEENEKDLPKKGKKGIKLKGKGEDRINIRGASVTDGTVQKTAKFDTGKAGETLPGKGQEIAPQARDGKSKKKGADTSETERGSLHKVLSSASEKLPKQPGKPEIATKSKETVELKKRRSAMKGS